MRLGIASADYLRADFSPLGVDQWGGAGWARIGQYVDLYRAAGHQVHVGTLWSEGTKGLSIEDSQRVKVFPDVIIMQRIMHDGVSEAMKIGQALGQVIINDVDDWYWGLDPNNQAFDGSHPKKNAIENTRFYGANIAASDIVTVSTPYLAERLATRVRCPIVHIPNYVDVSRFTPVVQSPGIPTVGWAGSTGHRSGDVETVAGVLKPAVMSGKIKLHHSGDSLESPSFARMIKLNKEMVSTTPRCNAADYPSLLNFDVGIVPLRDTPFNVAKSDIKGLEYAASGIPFIAQALPEYVRLYGAWDYGDGPGFFLAKRPKDWIRGIQKYLDYDFRLWSQARLLDRVRERDIHIGAQEWLGLLQGVVH